MMNMRIRKGKRKGVMNRRRRRCDSERYASCTCILTAVAAGQ
jgi:hypothetical protein